jgi:hypothetical protein
MHWCVAGAEHVDFVWLFWEDFSKLAESENGDNSSEVEEREDLKKRNW